MTVPFAAPKVLYRDADILVVDKPVGVSVHASPGVWRSLDATFDALRFGLKWVPVLAHRLDRETSGCLVLGRHPQAVRKLNTLFADRLVDKTYWAIVVGVPAAECGKIDLPLRRVRRQNRMLTIVDPSGQTALTEWKVCGQADGCAWLELHPLTGRTHQLRVHCAEAGFGILGDALYGRRVDPDGRLLLHARAVSIPWNKRRISVTAPPPSDMIEILKRFGYESSAVEPIDS